MNNHFKTFVPFFCFLLAGLLLFQSCTKDKNPPTQSIEEVEIKVSENPQKLNSDKTSEAKPQEIVEDTIIKEIIRYSNDSIIRIDVEERICDNEKVPAQKLNGYPLGFLDGQGSFSVMKTKEIRFIPLYNKPGGIRTDSIKLVYQYGVGGAYTFFKNDVDINKLHDFKDDAYFEAGYKKIIKLLKYYEIQDNFIRVYGSGQDSKWIDYNDVCKYVKPTRFIEDICKGKLYKILGYNNYRLRDAPSLNGNVIIKLDRKKHVVTEFTKIDGNWAYAKVYETKIYLNECFSMERVLSVGTGNIYEGWIRVVDENGQIKDIEFDRTGC